MSMCYTMLTLLCKQMNIEQEYYPEARYFAKTSVGTISICLWNLLHYQSDTAITLLLLYTTPDKHNPLILTYADY